MSVQGYTQSAIVAAYSKAVPVEYTYVAAITIVLYDSLILFNREVEYIYKGRQTLIKWIYLLIKLTGLTIFVLNFLAYLIPPQTPTPMKVSSCGYPHEIRKIATVENLSRCLVRQWFSGFLFEIVDTAVIKTLLVLRLRALYGNNNSVTAMLCLATAVEMMSTTYAYVLTGLNLQQFISSPAPIPGCPLRPGNHLRRFRSPTVVWATRFTSNSLELILLLFGLYRSLKANGSYFRNGWARMRQAAPLLYVFYRDGTIFYIPLCALSIFGFAATLTRLTREFTCSNWEAWLGITYYIVGTRLILNIREAGLKFSTSMFTGQGQELSSLVFSPDRESTMEGDVATFESPQTTSTVEVLEISRATKDGSSKG